MEITPLAGVANGVSQAFPTQNTTASGTDQSPVNGFNKLMEDMISKVSNLQNDADQKINSLVSGQGTGLHEVMLAVEKASISFQMLTQVRNKAVDAYQEIMRMSV
jgi:flagellar hook-basal body complex protein FliE